MSSTPTGDGFKGERVSDRNSRSKVNKNTRKKKFSRKRSQETERCVVREVSQQRREFERGGENGGKIKRGCYEAAKKKGSTRGKIE